jgi:hypothetical protein
MENSMEIVKILNMEIPFNSDLQDLGIYSIYEIRTQKFTFIFHAYCGIIHTSQDWK